MAELSTMARPYAKAIFDLAQQAKTLPAWSEVLSGLAQAVATDEVAGLIGHPGLTRSELGNALVEALPDADAPVHNLVRLLAENSRLRLLPAIYAEYEQLRAAAESRIEIRITTASGADDSIKQSLSAAVAKRLQREVSVSRDEDESLIGGAVIRAGDLVIDGSVAGELERMRQAVAS